MGFLTGHINDSPDITKDVAILDKFVVTVRWLSPKQRDEIGKQCTEYKRGMPDINRERHARAYTKRAIVGWEGLTLEVLEKLRVSIHATAVDALREVEKKNNGTLPYNQEDASLIYLNALPEKFANKIKDAMDEIDDNSLAEEDIIEKK
jgi:hypothetical protein